MFQSLYQVNISLTAFRQNLEKLYALAPNFIPVIKADAYGHGIIEIAQACLHSSAKQGLKGFAVGNIGEGVFLRDAGIEQDIYALLGVENNEDCLAAKEKNIICLVHNKETLEYAAQYSLSIALKIDSGMRRLGFIPEEIPYVLSFLQAHPQINTKLIASHLAMADVVNEDGTCFTHKQAKVFFDIVSSIRNVFPSVQSSLGQSAGTLAFPDLKGDVARFGIAMYGANPFYGTPKEEKGSTFLPVMSVSAPILSVHTLKEGEGIGYGQIFKAPHTMQVAVVGIGYADGYRRNGALMQTAPIQALINNTRADLLGRVAMQMSFFDVTHCPCKVGDKAYLLGGGTQANTIRSEELASWWDTIPYEPMCLFGKTNHKSYF